VVLVAVGDFKKDEAIRTIRGYVNSFPGGKGYSVSRPVEPEQTSPRVLVSNAKVNKGNLDLSWHMPSVNDPGIPAFDILEIILGQGKTSRLYNKLKMEKNLVRSIGAGAYSMADPGLFSINAELNPDAINSVLDAIIEEVARIKNVPVSEEELSRAKKMVETDFLSTMETMKGQAQTLAFFETMKGDMNKVDDYLKRLNAVTAEDIMNLANQYLTPGNLSAGILVPEGYKPDISEDYITHLFSVKSEQYEKKVTKVSEKSQGETARVVLPNGARLIIKENHALPLASVSVAFLGGTRLENEAEAGISGFTARMLTRGTGTRSAAEIASTVESWAGSMEGFSGRNSFGISAELLSSDMDNGLELLSDIILNPSFPDEETEKVREDMLIDIKAKNDNPTSQLNDLFSKTIYQTHPYGHPVTGTEETMKSIRRADLIKWYKALAVPSNMVITVVGDVEKDAFTEKITELFKDFNSSGFITPVVQPEPTLKGIRNVHFERQGAQAHIMIGYLDAALGTKDDAVMTIVDTVLSGQGGRLFSELRDKQSLAYSVSSFRRPGLETGLFAVYLGCAPDKLKTAKKALFTELDKIKKKGITEQELADAKRYVLGNDAISSQTNSDQAMQMGLNELYGLGYDHKVRFNREINEVTLKDVKETLGKILIPNGYAIVTIGPGRE
jgi:zinc protease